MSIKKPWVDGPFRLIPASSSGDSVESRVTGARAVAAEMTVIHNAIIRGINAIYLQCINVGEKGTAKDKTDFANFAARWSELVHEHHHTEEDGFFAGIEEITETPGLMQGNLQEHEAFHAGLENFSEYVVSVAEGKTEYDGQKVKDLIDSFMPDLNTHLENEIGTLVSLDKWDHKLDWNAWFQEDIGGRVKEMMKKQRYRTHIFPTAFILHDKTFEGGVWQAFPPIHWIMAAVLRVLFVRVNQDWWRFAGCDGWSVPKELPFV